MLPLKGMKVVEIAQNIAGPYAGEILAALGADVLKIERPDGGDDARGWGPPFEEGMATTFHVVNRNKRSVTIDLKEPDQLARLKRYISECDVLVQNMRPESLEGFGLGEDDVRKLNPKLIYCSISAYGHKGPMRLHGGYEPMIQAAAGMFAMNGQEGGPPTRVGMQVLDLGSGVWAALGAIAGLLERTSTGQGCVVDTSLYETALGWLSVHFAAFLATGEHPVRHGSGNPKVVVFQSFVTSDGEIVVAAANDRLFNKFSAAIGKPDWIDAPCYKTNALRVANKSKLIPTIARIMLDQPTEVWIERLSAAGVPSAPIRDFHEVAEDPQLSALGLLQSIPGTRLQAVGLPLNFNKKRPPIHSRAPMLGEHNADFDL